VGGCDPTAVRPEPAHGPQGAAYEVGQTSGPSSNLITTRCRQLQICRTQPHQQPESAHSGTADDYPSASCKGPQSVRARSLTSIGSDRRNGGRKMWHPSYPSHANPHPKSSGPQILFLIFLLINIPVQGRQTDSCAYAYDIVQEHIIGICEAPLDTWWYRGFAAVVPGRAGLWRGLAVLPLSPGSGGEEPRSAPWF
jgi:hypothetical protein